MCGWYRATISRMKKEITTIFVILHYGMKIDAYDVGVILAKTIDPETIDPETKKLYGVYAIDFDKFGNYNDKYPYCIDRKLTETNN